MWPTIQSGDVLTAAPLDGEAPQTGEVVVYRQGERWLVHRIVSVTTATTSNTTSAAAAWTLRGDAKRGCDHPVPPSAIVARIVAIERHGVRLGLDGHGGPLRDRLRARARRTLAWCRDAAWPEAA